MNKKIAISSLIFVIIISGIIFILAVRANNELEQTVSEQFNTQQLILARKIAQDIQAHFGFLEAALATYASHGQQTDLREKSGYYHQILEDWQVLALGMFYLNHRKELAVSSPDLDSFQDLGIELDRHELAEHFTDRRLAPFFYSQTIIPEHGPLAETAVLVMVTLSPYVHESLVINNSPGIIPMSFFVVDARETARRYAHGVVSGKTGYPWVIDDRGYFLYHVEKDFLGRDSTTVRRDRNPEISYDRINSITSRKLLQGKEGTDWYITGWHYDVISEMKKLLAYSPVIFSAADPDGAAPRCWSVGLAAPETEVYGLIEPMVLRQWTVLGLFSLVVVSGLLALYLLSLRWNQTLTAKVEEKTRHLVRSQDLLRREKEKVELSLKALVSAQQELVRAERFAAIGEAASHLSHEIKNPLMLMSGFANQVKRSMSEDDPNREKLNIISGEAKRLESMLNQVRDFTRPQTLKKEKGQINDLIRETVKLVREQLDMSGISLELHLDPDLPQTKFDKAQMKQVLINLIKNAWEAIPDKGRVAVSTARKNSGILISIEDSGAGISQEMLKKIFSPFFTTKDQGTGLGLAVIYRIVQDHQGEITVSSEPDQGSTFRVYLPPG